MHYERSAEDDIEEFESDWEVEEVVGAASVVVGLGKLKSPTEK